jgi:hypothetical protein
MTGEYAITGVGTSPKCSKEKRTGGMDKKSRPAGGPAGDDSIAKQAPHPNSAKY